MQPFWGLLIDIEEFESKLCTYLEDRASAANPSSGSKGVSSAWLGMLFAVLAVSTNYCELSYHKRVEISQNYGEPCHDASYHRMTPDIKYSPDVLPLSTALQFLPSSIIRLSSGSSYPGASAGE